MKTTEYAAALASEVGSYKAERQEQLKQQQEILGFKRRMK
jgi:hypothetical protein